jgi:hypothetical protein
MTRRLRQGSGRNGLILANGGVLSYQHAICISSSPPKQGTPYPDSEALGKGDLDPIPPVDFEAEGPAKIEVSGTRASSDVFARDTFPGKLISIRRILLNSNEMVLRCELTS